jgi:hypothetical protein
MMGTKAQKQGLVWGGLLVLFGIVMLVETFADLSEWIWVAILTVAGLAVFAVFLTDRSDWGLLIPAYVMWAVAGMLVLITLNILQDEAIATYVLSAVALPFVVGFLRNQERWGLLIPAYILLAVGVMVGLIGAGVLNDLLIPAYVLFAVSLPFFVVYARNPKQWWPLIPGGITAAIGLSFLIAENAAQYIAAIALIVVGGWIVARQFLGKGEAVEETTETIEAKEPPAE